MNTSQKLTLGIAAVFMVTLTIVGVTYAYFVTRVTGDTTESVNVKTAEVGSVVYEAGNGTGDLISLEKVLPGTTLYKTFKVTNESADQVGGYTIYLESYPEAGKPQFVHGTNGDKVDDSDSNVCYKSTSKPSNDGSPTSTCFDDTDYDNIYVTLYEFEDDTEFNKITETGTVGEAQLTTPTVNETHVAALSGTGSTSHATQDLTDRLTISGGATKYYVLKVEYKNNNANQNIENEAALTLKVSIK